MQKSYWSLSSDKLHFCSEKNHAYMNMPTSSEPLIHLTEILNMVVDLKVDVMVLQTLNHFVYISVILWNAV
jgi:hypothetical protein